MLPLDFAGDLISTEMLKKNPELNRQNNFLRGQLKDKVEKNINKVFSKYCPDQCILESVDLSTQLIQGITAQSYREDQIFFSSNRDLGLKVDGVDVSYLIDDRLDINLRAEIQAVLEGSLRFVTPVNYIANSQPFPDSYQKRLKKEKLLSEDPYGLDKLKNMLRIFRDLAGTKEIITNSTNSSTSDSTKQSSLSSKSLNSSLEKNNSELNSMDSFLSKLSKEEIIAYLAGGLVFLALIIVFIARFARAKKDASEMMFNLSTLPGADKKPEKNTEENDSFEQNGETVTNQNGRINFRLKVDELKNELIDVFLENPRVAKETFSRLLKEDGVEETSKYIHIFGHLIVFELLGDPSLQRDLYELSEYFHSSTFDFDIEEQLKLLQKLKTRCTASEIKVLTLKSSDKFEFLNKLDAGQIYKLIVDEKINIQSIVLTQLDRKRRRSVFDMYEGESKVSLLSELSRADTIPKEFLYNVAKALQKKVQSSPEFDTENLRTSDILLDLLEKASLVEQKTLMTTLVRNNPETARSIKMKLISVQILPFLKDGHLLELVLGMEREDLLAFIMGTEDHIRDLLLDKAPGELSESWQEDMSNFGTVDEQVYRVKEMQVLNRIRNMANNGVFNLLDINEKIFDGINMDESLEEEEMPNISTTAIAG